MNIKLRRQVVAKINLRLPLTLAGFGYALLGIGAVLVGLRIFGIFSEDVQSAYLVAGIMFAVGGLLLLVLGYIMARRRVEAAFRGMYKDVLQAVQEVDSTEDLEFVDNISMPL